ALPLLLLAHSGEPLQPGDRPPLQPNDLWSAWEFDPGVIIPLVVSAVLYAIGSRRDVGSTNLRKSCFWLGWLTVAIALVSPLHPLGEVLFSAHMVQHEILMLLSAPLLVLSRPLVTFLWALPFNWRRTLGRFSKRPAVTATWTFFTTAFTAWWIHAVAIWTWHLPFLFDLTLKSDLAHTAQHLSFFVSALLFWWALFYAHGRRAHGSAVLYLFTTAVHTDILGALLTFAPHIWYPPYSHTTQAWNLTPLQDQQIGGLIMWVPANLVYIAAGLTLFAAWLKESDALLGRNIVSAK
ncbi:MAG: cytochrome c oxidase assembly protein, partial [Acidobacteriaceae bacterium]|nr:cytochrome c oxidase assembly protein [Acidobacteriaceae bacterium]